MAIRVKGPGARIGDAGRASEKRLAKALGGRQTPASGAMQGAKGDIEAGVFLVEAKSTTSASLSVKLDWCTKITVEARDKNKVAALAVTFTTGDGRPVKFGSWVMIPQREFDEYRAWRERDEQEQADP